MRIGNRQPAGPPGAGVIHARSLVSKSSKHVIPNPSGGWAVKNSGAARASRKFHTQAEAIEYGRAAAKTAHTELYIHRRDGTIQDRNSYGNEPFPAKHKK